MNIREFSLNTRRGGGCPYAAGPRMGCASACLSCRGGVWVGRRAGDASWRAYGAVCCHLERGPGDRPRGVVALWGFVRTGMGEWRISAAEDHHNSPYT